MSNYAKGANRERRWCEDQRRAGALWAGRIAGSHGIIDCLALYRGKLVMAQIKAGTGTMEASGVATMQYFASQMRDAKVPVSFELYSYPDRKPVKVRVF